ncbi:hypothetical protein TNCV_2429481 [Trichonephila clavipes]|nr:hypothetical protein TNCV_2429481 [Trichonephila clavipes]
MGEESDSDLSNSDTENTKDTTPCTGDSASGSGNLDDSEDEGFPVISHKKKVASIVIDATGSDVVQSGRPIFDDFFQHLWPYIGNNTANVVFQMVKRLWLIRIDQ